MSIAPVGATCVVVLAHGLGSDRDESERIFKNAAAALGVHGIATVRFDFRGNGLSERRHHDVTLDGYVADLSAVMAHAAGTFDSVVLLGASHGGLVTVLCVTPPLRAPQLVGVVLWNPVLRPRSVLVDAASGPFEISEGLVRDWASDSVAKTVTTTLADLPLPVLIVHGTADSVVPVGDSRAAATLNPSIQLRELPAVEHGLGAGADEAIDLTVAFVASLTPPTTRE